MSNIMVFHHFSYHQKYMLQHHPWLLEACGINPGDHLIKSHVAARLNGYIGGMGLHQNFKKKHLNLGSMIKWQNMSWNKWKPDIEIIREDITILFLLWGKIIIMRQKMAEDFVLNMRPEKNMMIMVENEILTQWPRSDAQNNSKNYSAIFWPF